MRWAASGKMCGEQGQQLLHCGPRWSRSGRRLGPWGCFEHVPRASFEPDPLVKVPGQELFGKRPKPMISNHRIGCPRCFPQGGRLLDRQRLRKQLNAEYALLTWTPSPGPSGTSTHSEYPNARACWTHTASYPCWGQSWTPKSAGRMIWRAVVGPISVGPRYPR